MNFGKQLWKASETPSRLKNYLRVAWDIILFVALVILIYAVIAWPVGSIMKGQDSAQLDGMLFLIVDEAMLMVAVLAAVFLVLRFRKMPLRVFRPVIKWQDIFLGTMSVLMIYFAGFLICMVTDAVQVVEQQVNPGYLGLTALFFLLVAVTEEMAMRGFVLGRLLDYGINKFWALFISSLLFSLMHLFNPHFAFIPFLNIILAGFMLGASFIYTRNLVFSITAHLLWNWVQGPVFGFQVSGLHFADSCFTLELSGSSLINGGSFGFEGSLVCTVLIIVITLILVKQYSETYLRY